MEHKKIYDAVSIALGVLFLYALYNLVQGFIYNHTFTPAYFFYITPVLLGITGLLIFVTSGYKKSGLLRVFMCYELFAFPFTVFYYYTIFTRDTSLPYMNYSLGWQFYAGIAVNLLYVTVSAVGLWYITKKRVPKIIYFGTGENRVGQFAPANGGLRFANRLIDAIIIVTVALRSISSFYSLRNGFNRSIDIEDSPFLLYLIEIPAIIIYYLLLEGIFNTTAGKSATNTTIVNDSGERPGFAKILGRTFCRLIPFDALSFFGAGARGWHDRIPNTYVVESIDADDVHEHEITLDAETNLL